MDDPGLPSVYLVVPDPVERARIKRALAGYAREIITFENGRDYLAQPIENVHACVILDIALQDMRPADFVLHARRDVPIIVVGHVEELSMVVALIRAGAADVLDVPDARTLRASLRTAKARANR